MLAGHPRSQIREGAWRKGSFISSGKVRIHSGSSTFLRTLVRTVGSTRYMGITRSTAPTCFFLSARRWGRRLGRGSKNITLAGVSKRTASTLKSTRSEEHTSELQSHSDLVCRLLLEKKKEDGEQLSAGAL